MMLSATAVTKKSSSLMLKKISISTVSTSLFYSSYKTNSVERGHGHDITRSFSRLSIKNAQQQQQRRQFSSNSSATAILRKFKQGNLEDLPSELTNPSNLKIDPRSTSSPFYGLEKINTIVETDEEGEWEENDIDDDDGDGDEVYDSDVEDEEESNDSLAYSLKHTDLTEPVFVKPLPERLHVPIYSLFDDFDHDEGAENESDNIGTIHLDPEVFGCDPIRVDILQRVVQYQRNKKRGKRFPALSKTIGTKSGSGKKMRPQKGQGRARAGHKRPPHWRGGAKAHGPKGIKQDYTTKINKKVKAMGIKHALSQKLKEGNLILVDHMKLDGSFKTRDMARVLENFGIGGKTDNDGANAYMLDSPEETEEEEEEVVTGVFATTKLAVRNLKKVKLSNYHRCNVYDLLKYEKLVISLPALTALETKYGSGN